MSDIGYLQPASQAFSRMKDVLFRPFDVGKWFVLGFTAWLANLGEGGSSLDLGGGDTTGEHLTGGGQLSPEALSLIVLVVVLVAAFVLVLLVAMTWVSSRGKFMFIDNLLHNRALVTEPWSRFKSLANSLFLWRFGYGLVVLTMITLVAAISVLGSVEDLSRMSRDSFNIPLLLTGLSLLIPICLVAGFISMLLDHFIMPLMYKHQADCMTAWGIFMRLLRSRFWSFVGYGLFLMLLSIPFVVVLLLAIIATCCILGLILCMPYLWAVVLLPVLVWIRFFAMEFLAQFGADYDLFTEEELELELAPPPPLPSE